MTKGSLMVATTQTVDSGDRKATREARCGGRCGAAWGVPALLALAAAGASAAELHPADAVYENGYVYTVDAHDSVQHAFALRDGEIVYVGDDAGAKRFIGTGTQVVDLHGRMTMPGLVDGHMHPLDGGVVLLGCNLNYERLTVAQMQAKIQSCLDQTKDKEPDSWLMVSNWFQEAMLPAGTITSRVILDALHTRRPILVVSSFGHTGLANTRALQLAAITAKTPDPLGGVYARDASGNPTGLLQDAAFESMQSKIPERTAAEDVKAAEAALDAMRAQGITTFLDAAATPRTIAAFAGAEKEGHLTARAHFAVLIRPPEGREPVKAVAFLKSMAQRYDQGEIVPEPRITVRNFKMFLDGVTTAPALTGAMLEPYWQGTAASPHWVAGKNRGPAVDFPAPVLPRLVIEAA